MLMISTCEKSSFSRLFYLIIMTAFVFIPFCVLADDAKNAPPPSKVKVSQVLERTAAETAKIIGIIYYERVSNISSETAGLVESVYFDEGMTVKKGEILVRTDTALLNKDLEIEALKLDGVEINIEKTKKDLARYEELYKNNAASEKDYEDLTYQLRRYLNDREEIKKAMEKIRLTLSKTVIKAPFDGIILEKSADKGEWIVPGKVVFRLASLKDMYAKAPIYENHMAFINKGDKLNVIINAYNKPVEGEIAGTLQEADPKTKNVFVKIKLPYIDNVVENMSVTVFSPISHKTTMTFVPRDALITAKGKDFVYTVKEGKAAIIPIEIISYSGAFIGVKSPFIKPGMVVIIDGNERLRPDQPVVIATDEKQGEKS